MKNYAEDFYKLVVSLGGLPSDKNFIVKRDDFMNWMMDRGYSKVTADQHCHPSFKRGMVHILMNAGLLTDGGVKRWCIPCVQSLMDHQVEKKPLPLRFYEGNKPQGDGWMRSARLDDYSDDDKEWRLYRQEWKDGCNNLKVVAHHRVANKANFWLKSKNGRILMTKDALILKNHHPDIFESLLETVKELSE